MCKLWFHIQLRQQRHDLQTNINVTQSILIRIIHHVPIAHNVRCIDRYVTNIP